MKLITLLATALVLTACVPKKKYDELQGNYDAAMEAGASEKSQLLAQLTAEQQKASTLGNQLAELQAKHANLLKDKSALDADVAQMELALRELEQRKSEADARIKEFQDLLGKFKELIDSGKLKVKIVAGRMVVELATDILFGSGSAALSKEGKEALADVGSVLASIPDRQFQVEGHTDNVPIRTERFPSNWELASARAVTVVQALVEGGVPVENLSAASLAENRPVDTNKTKEGKAANRRIEIVVVPDLSTLPGAEQLERLGE